MVQNRSRPVITGTAAVGRTLTAHPGQWAPRPEGLTYRWFARARLVATDTGATSDLPVTRAYAGRRISVSVTARHDGYRPATAWSRPTIRVARTHGG